MHSSPHRQREEHWFIVDLIGKAGQMPLPHWVRCELDAWLTAAAVDRGKLFRNAHRVGKIWGDSIMEKAVWPHREGMGQAPV